MKLSIAQKIIKIFSSASLFEKIKEDSKRYRFTCSCGKKSCRHCGKFTMQSIFKVK